MKMRLANLSASAASGCRKAIVSLRTFAIRHGPDAHAYRGDSRPSELASRGCVIGSPSEYS